MRATLAFLMLLAVVLSGCSSNGGGDGDGSSTSDSGSSSGTDSGTSSKSTSSTRSSTGTASSSNTGTGAAGNRAPTGSMAASVAGGAIPLHVNFTLTGNDQDGDALSWTLSFGDGNATNGAQLPASPQHNFTRAGNFTATYVVSDGKLNNTYTATINVTGAAGGQPALSFVGDVAVDCSVNCGGCSSTDPSGILCSPIGGPGALGCASFSAGEPGFDCTWVEIPASLAGHTFLVTSTGGDPDVEFIDVCSQAEAENSETVWNSGPESGVVPAGMTCMMAFEWNPVGADGSTITMVIQ